MKQIQRSLLQFFTLIIVAIVILLFPTGKGKPANGSGWNAYPAPPDQVKDPSDLPYKINLPVIIAPVQPPPPPPQSSVSRYIYSKNWTYLHDTSGCAEGTAANPSAFVFLDFGSAWIDTSTNPHTYGSLLLDMTTHLTISEIEQAAKDYLAGYYSCAPSGATIYVAIGINNFIIDTPLNSAHGQAWAEMIKRVYNWTLVYPPYNDKIKDVYGAIDLEPGWSAPTYAISWIQGYDGVPDRRHYFNVGTCDSCPYRYGNQDHTNWLLPNGWNLDQLWYASYGPQSARVIPEIYTKMDAPENYFPAHEAYQWQNLKYWGMTCSGGCLPSYPPYSQWRTMYFGGTLTQYDACHDPANPRAQNCRDIYQDNTPAQGWQLFWNALASNNLTKQSLGYSTDMTWKH
jgi:hypothetical protein